MKRPLSLILLMVLFSFSSCGPGEDKVERIIEGGVEVVINHIDPYVLGGEPSRLVLEEQFVIDLENENFAQLGISDPVDFDVDTERKIYL